MTDHPLYVRADTLTPAHLATLREHALSIRQSIIRMLLLAKSGHSAGPLGMADVFTALYFQLLKHDPRRPDWDERDYVLLSNGHICPVWYATLAEAGYFPKQELLSLRQLGSRLQGHPHLGSLPGVENTGGPLGQGLSQACGLALALNLDQRKNRIYCLLSDGEHQEGQTWEAYMLAAKYRLHQITVMIDRNNIQIDGFTEDIMPLEPLADKLTAFGWHVQVIDGHDIEAIIKAARLAEAVAQAPSAIICQTVPGKNITAMENDYHWHGQPPTVEQAKAALAQLRTLKGQHWQE